MDLCQEILKKWQDIQDVDAERNYFDKYTKARTAYLEGLKKSATGSIKQEDLKKLYDTEKDLFVEYLENRINLKG